MPIYEYKCPDCGHTFDAIQKMSDDPIRVCPACGADQVKKLVSATSFVLKGSGWYKDHYGLKSGGDSATGGGADAAPAAPAAAAAPATPAATTPSSGSGSSGTPASS